MAKIYNLGSLNLDHVYRIDRFVTPGETLTIEDYQLHLGGKGLNHSVAIARGGGNITHIGCVPKQEQATFHAVNHDNLTWHLQDSDLATGHAIIQVDAKGENQILLYPGSNCAINFDHIAAVELEEGDWFLCQNETNFVPEALEWAKSKGAIVAYAAAPFDVDAAQRVLPYLDILAMNAIECEQLTKTLGRKVSELGLNEVLVTKGADGVDFYQNGKVVHLPSYKVKPVDTTGAGDCFFGSYLSQRVQGIAPAKAIRYAQAAAAIKVTRLGAAQSFPTTQDVLKFLDEQS